MSAPNRALAVLPNDRDTQALAARIAPAWPQDVNHEQAIDIARIALAYGLDPFLGELIPYQGRPYLTFDGRVRIADNHPEYDGYDHGPVVGPELQAMRPKDGEVVWKCTVYRRDRSHPTVAYGRAGGSGERNVVGRNDPVTMAQKRAIHRALRAAFPVPIPGVEDAATSGQIKAIHALDDEQGVTRPERRAALEGTFGVSASNELTADQASAYLDARAVSAGTPEIDPDAEYGMADEVAAIDKMAEAGELPDPDEPAWSADPKRHWTEFWVGARKVLGPSASRPEIERLVGHAIDTAGDPRLLWAEWRAAKAREDAALDAFDEAAEQGGGDGDAAGG